MSYLTFDFLIYEIRKKNLKIEREKKVSRQKRLANEIVIRGWVGWMSV